MNFPVADECWLFCILRLLGQKKQHFWWWQVNTIHTFPEQFILGAFNAKQISESLNKQVQIKYDSKYKMIVLFKYKQLR